MISAVAPTVGALSGTVAGAASKIPGREDFLKLLMTQMRYQNPLDPVKDSEFVAQLSQFSTLDGIQALNSSFKEMLLLQQLTQGANLIGKTVVYEKPGASLPRRGTVEAVNVQNGQLQLLVEGTAITLAQVRGIEQSAKT
jgi:flagellar basal-body rod modification protein FlgD